MTMRLPFANFEVIFIDVELSCIVCHYIELYINHFYIYSCMAVHGIKTTVTPINTNGIVELTLEMRAQQST
jgi:uncharacterized protein YunC (DUF1805 family)